MKLILLLLVVNIMLFGSNVRLCKINECEFNKHPDGSAKSDFAMAGINGIVIKIVDFDKIKFYNEELVGIYETYDGELIAKIKGVLFYRGFLYVNLNNGVELKDFSLDKKSSRELKWKDKLLDRDSQIETKLYKGSKYTVFIKIDFYSHDLGVMYMELVTVKNQDTFSAP